MKTANVTLVALFALILAVTAAEPASSSETKSFQIRNCKFDLLLRPKDANNSDGTPIVLYTAEPWKCMTWKMLPVGDSTFHLQNHFTGKTLEGKTNQTSIAVVQVPDERDSAKRPAWHFTKLPNGFYRIANCVGQVLTGRGREQVILTPWEDKQEQQWQLIEIDPATLAM